MGRLFGLTGIWFSAPVADFLSTALTYFLIRREMFTLKNLLKKRHKELVKSKIEGRLSEEEEIELKAKID